MRTVLIYFVLCLSFVDNVFCQDTAQIPFKGKDVILLEKHQCVSWLSQDSLARDTVISIGSDKFFYLKRSDGNNLPVECGQLGLYRVADKLYLLREGMWVLERTDKKILFENSGNNEPLMEELPTDPSPTFYSDKQKKKLKARRVLETRTSNNPEK